MQPARLPRADVPGVYRRIAPVHDVLAVLVEARARRLGLDWAAVQDGERVLEVAVGTGLSFVHLLRQNPSGLTVGIDRTPAMLRRARRRAARYPAGRYRLEPGDAYALAYPDRHFDLVLNSYMFDMLPEDDFVPVLREFYRVLRPGGRLVMVNMTLGGRAYHRLWEWIYRIHPPLLGGCRGVAVAPALGEAGFERVRRRFVSQWTFPSEVVFGMRGGA
ncbi:MAG: methyltransferase domain-containing protein [Rhodothermales bacterium]|nr:methyltransferase domain-containing protein [Rhodothermales bacterium]